MMLDAPGHSTDPTQVKRPTVGVAQRSAGRLGPFRRQERSGEPRGGTLARPAVAGRGALDSLQRRVRLVMIRSAYALHMATMTAIVHNDYGTAPEDVLRLAEVDKPTMADDQVLVRVHAASVDRGTWHIIAGLPYPIRVAGFGLRKPKYLNPGRSLAGTVKAVGNKVTGSKPGDEVFGICAGSFAEYVCVRTDKLAPKPTNLGSGH